MLTTSADRIALWLDDYNGGCHDDTLHSRLFQCRFENPQRALLCRIVKKLPPVRLQTLPSASPYSELRSTQTNLIRLETRVYGRGNMQHCIDPFNRIVVGIGGSDVRDKDEFHLRREW